MVYRYAHPRFHGNVRNPCKFDIYIINVVGWDVIHYLIIFTRYHISNCMSRNNIFSINEISNNEIFISSNSRYIPPPQIQLASICMCVNISASVSLGCLFTPKVYIVIFQPYKNVRQGSGQGKVRCRRICLCELRRILLINAVIANKYLK